jgi:hypothetical protein
MELLAAQTQSGVMTHHGRYCSQINLTAAVFLLNVLGVDFGDPILCQDLLSFPFSILQVMKGDFCQVNRSQVQAIAASGETFYMLRNLPLLG